MAFHGHHGGHNHAGSNRRRDHDFSQVPRANIPRSAFNRSHCHKSTFSASYLVPFYVDEVLPGDTFAARAHLFCRLATPIVPIMDNLYLETFYFFVPNRLLWDNWQRFNGEQDNPGDSTDYTVPEIAFDGDPSYVQTGDMLDYMGIPINISGLHVNALHCRAYNLIYNTWFRDQNLTDSISVLTDDGPDSQGNYPLQRRARFHDYFTSCLPWPQKGPGVELPLGATAPVIGDGESTGFTEGDNAWGLASSGEDMGLSDHSVPIGTVVDYSSLEGVKAVGLNTDPTLSHVFADLSTATAATIDSIRQAFQLQKLYERDARGGTRYTEIIRSHFGVISPDSRLQRPEYLGGSSDRINVHPVQQTSSSDSTSPQGNLAAFGVGASNSGGFRKSFVEHGVILGLVQVRGDITYSQGINRMWSRQTRFDFYWPALAMIGEQAVLAQEIYAQGNEADTTVFGYQERWAEYRYLPSRLSGLMRPQATDPLDYWHLGEDYSELPTLSSGWIADVTDLNLNRCIAVTSQPQFIFDSFIDLKCARPMPLYSVPGLVDHF
nr:MAG: major capsid protein [Microviridae sp.]